MTALFAPTDLVVPFEKLRMSDVDTVGGKNASLGEMISQLPQGVRVPTGFATTAHAFREFLKHDGLDARIQAELLLAIFQTSSPMHDGGVIIHKHRIHSSGCLLPLSQNPNIDKRYGTRHRAALGLSEETDAIVIVVSEETQVISMARNGRLTPFKEEAQLLATLKAIFYPRKKSGRWPVRSKAGAADAKQDA